MSFIASYDPNNIVLKYEGIFSQEVTKSVISQVEQKCDDLGEDASIKRKIVNVLVECLQNICKHADGQNGAGNMQPSFLLGKDQSHYVIFTSNAISKEKVTSVEDKLKEINALDKDGLKGLYKTLISNGEISDKGGAGLGFVDIARKTGEKIDYEFKDIDGTYACFNFKVKVPTVKE